MAFHLEKLKDRLGSTELVFVESLESTNTHALDLVRSSQLDSPTLILCNRQLAGRGQRGNSWWSSEDSLTMTWCFPTSKPPYPHGMLALAAGLAAERGIADHLGDSIRLAIKWPNDLLIDGKKVAGILVESAPMPAPRLNCTALVVGIGINVNQTEISNQIGGTNSIEPSSLRLSLDLSSPVDHTELTISIVESLEHHYISAPLSTAELTQALDSKIFYKHQKICLEQTNNNSVFGILQGIGPDGGVVIETDSGIQSFYSGTLRPTSKD